MSNERHLASTITALLSALLITLFIVACEPKEQGPPPEPKGMDVFVTFEGPWAIVPDPKDSNSVLAIAPKTKSHRPLGVVPADTALEAGIYDLAIPVHGERGKPEADKNILRADIDPQAVQLASGTRGERYVIRLPKPDAYLAETSYLSRISTKYPPDASEEKNYATAVALRYHTASKIGFQLSGTPDDGPAFKPLLLELNTPLIRFTIDPLEVHLHDDCYLHAREAFRDLVRLVRLKLYIDFAGPEECRKQDPQLLPAKKALLLNPLSIENTTTMQNDMQLRAAGFSGNILDTYVNSVARSSSKMGAAIYFFSSDTGGCKAPIILNNGG